MWLGRKMFISIYNCSYSWKEVRWGIKQRPWKNPAYRLAYLGLISLGYCTAWDHLQLAKNKPLYLWSDKSLRSLYLYHSSIIYTYIYYICYWALQGIISVKLLTPQTLASTVRNSKDDFIYKQSRKRTPEDSESIWMCVILYSSVETQSSTDNWDAEADNGYKSMGALSSWMDFYLIEGLDITRKALCPMEVLCFSSMMWQRCCV